MSTTRVDQATGLSASAAFKMPVRVATTADIELSGLQTIDGYLISDGDRVLVKDQTPASQNGIWLASTGVWSRAPDCDGAYDMIEGSLIFVLRGTVAGGAIYRQTTEDPTIGTDDLVFVVQSLNTLVDDGGDPVDFVTPSQVVYLAATRTLMKAVDTTSITSVYLKEGKRKGNWNFLAGNYSALVALDTREGMYAKADAISASVGAWVRDFEDTVDPYWFGAVGDLSADDQPAIVAACVMATSTAAGYHTVGLRQGNYRVDSSLQLATAYTRIEGVGAAVFITAGSGSIDIIDVSASYVQIRNLTLYNPYLPTLANACLKQSGGADCTFDKVECIGSWYGFDGTGGGDSVFNDSKIRGCYGDYIHLANYQGLWARRVKADGTWPVAAPINANLKGAWVTATAYVANDIVTKGGYAYQCRVAGTSGATGPVYTIMGTDIADGATLKWRIVGAVNRGGLLADSNTFACTFDNCDFTGGHFYGGVLTNTLGGTAPQGFVFSNYTEFGQPVYAGLEIRAGVNIDVGGCLVNSGISATSVGISVAASVKPRLHDNEVYGFFQGIGIVSTVNGALIRGNSIAGCTFGIEVGANTIEFAIDGNSLGTDSAWGNNTTAIKVDIGTSNYYKIVNNICHGAGTAVTDGGTGVNKTVAAND